MPTNSAATDEVTILREIVKNLENELLSTRQVLASNEQMLVSTAQVLASTEKALASRESTLAATEKRCASAERKISLLLEQLYLLRHRVFGASAEDASPQGRLFNEAEVVADADVADTAGHEADASPVDESAASPRRRAGRRPLPPHLPRVDIYHTLPEAERRCACGCVQQEIGTDISEQLDIVPAQICVLRKRSKTYIYSTGRR